MTYTGRDQDRVYSGENADVTFSLRRCIHAEACIKGLPQIFDKDRRPWIQVGDTSADALVNLAAAARPARCMFVGTTAAHLKQRRRSTASRSGRMGQFRCAAICGLQGLRS